MAVFARLKDGVTVAPRLFGKYLYPNIKTWIQYDDCHYDYLKADPRVELMDQNQMDTQIEENNQRIEDIINSQWRSAEKQVMAIVETDLLKQALTAAKNAGKNKIAQIIEDRIEELDANKK